MNRFGLRSIPFVLAILLLVPSCDSSPTVDDTDGTSTTPEWQTVFFDDFNRGDGSVGSSYAVMLYSPSNDDIAYDALISNNQVLLSEAHLAYWAVKYAQAVNSDTTRVSARFSVPTASSGASSFAVSTRATYASLSVVDGYFGGVGGGDLGINKITASSNGAMVPLASKPYSMQEGRWYTLELTLSGADLKLVVKDVASGATETVTATDPGPFPAGRTCAMNGVIGGGDVLAMDDFLIEALR